MEPSTTKALDIFELEFSGKFLERGFWLYIWEVSPKQAKPLFYIGRTGDSSSTKAQSPFNRMSQHLGFAKNSAMLRNHLEANNVKPEHCKFRLVAVGPLYPESMEKDRTEHDERRDLVAGMEKALAQEIRNAGYTVMNEVKSRKVLDKVAFAKVRLAFRQKFPELRSP